MRNIGISVLIAVLALIVLAGFLGEAKALMMALLLAMLEVALSLDNAVINAKTLKKLSPAWQKRFLIFGLPIAVFGVRFLLPLILVAVSSHLSLDVVMHQAMDDPVAYAQALEKGKPLLMGFGSGFLLMIFLFFFHEKYWGSTRIGVFLPILLGGLIGLCVSFGGGDKTGGWLLAGPYLTGVGLASGFHGLQRMSERFSSQAFQGIWGFCYLEILDISFSFDGVMGAFAITQNIFVMMVGLGIGALFVRTFTLELLKRKTFERWRYLDQGAHYAVLFLGLVMLTEPFYRLPEMAVAGGSFLILAISIILSRWRVFSC